MSGAVGYRFVGEVRARWRGWLGLALLVGAAAGAVTATAAGARRTETAHARFLETQRAADAAVYAPCLQIPATTCAKRLTALAAVDDAVVQSHFSTIMTTADGRSLQPDPSDNCYSGPGEVALETDVSGRLGRDFMRHRFVAGRAADPARADEAVISETIAQRLDLAPGDELIAAVPSSDASCGDEDEAVVPSLTTLRVVGVQRSPLELRPASGFYIASVHATPAFHERMLDAGWLPDQTLLVRLREGASLDEFRDQVEAAGIEAEVQGGQSLYDAVDDGLRPYAAALAVGAFVGLLAVVSVLAPAVVRRLRIDTSEDATLAQLGFTRAMLRSLALRRAVVVAVMVAAASAAAAVALSPLMPIGPARVAEPDPGLDIAWGALALGAVAAAAVVALCAIPSVLRPRVEGRPFGTRARLTVATARLPLTAWCGSRVALSRVAQAGGGVAAVTIAGVMFVGTLTFSAGVDRLLGTPRLLGLNWNAGALSPSAEEPEAGDPPLPSFEEMRDHVADDDSVLAHATGTLYPPFWQGQPMQLGPELLATSVFGFDPGSLAPSIVSGRAPVASDEILLGPKTSDELGLGIGDGVDAHGLEGEWEEPEPRPTDARYRIVGIGVLPPEAGDGLGFGSVLTIDGLRRLAANAEPEVVWMRLAPGTDRAALATRLYGPGVDASAAIIGDEESLLSADVSREALAIGRVDRAPLVVAGLLALIGASVLAHLVASTARANRRSLAVLAALGFTPGQRRRTVCWQAIALVAVPVVVGLPLGVVLGRAVFREYAAGLGAVPAPVTPWMLLAVLVPATLVAAIAVALGPAWRAGRLHPARVLRAE